MRDALRQHRRCGRLHRPGDARPRPRGTPSSSCTRSAPTRSPGRTRRRSTPGSTATAASASRGFITNDAALACEADLTFLCLSHEEAAALEPPSRGVVVDLSGAHRLGDPSQYEAWYGFTHPRPDELGALVVRAARAVAARGPAGREPGLLRDRGRCSRSARSRTRSSPDSVVVDAMSGMTGAGRSPKPSTHAGFVLENVSPYKVGLAPARRRDRAAARLPRLVHAPPAAPCGAGCSPRATSARPGADLRALLEERYATSPVVTVLPEGVAPELARVQHTDGAEIGVFDDRHTDRTIVICAIDNLGKGAAGQAVQNVNALFGLAGDGGAPARRGARLMSVTAAAGFVAVRRRAPGSGRPGKPDVALLRSVAPAVGGAMWTLEPRPGGARSSSRGATSSSRSRRPWSSTPASRTRRPARAGEEDARATAAARRGAARAPRGGGRRALDRRDRRRACRWRSCSPASTRRRPRSRPDGGADAARGDPHDGRRAEDGRPRRRRVHRRGDGEGRRDDPPCLATMLAVVTTDYPLEPGRGGRASSAPPSSSRSTGSRSTATARRTTRSCCSRTGSPGSPRDPRDGRAFAAALEEVCSDLARQIVADGEGATVVLEIAVHRRLVAGGGAGDRAPRRDLPAREDGRLRARSQLGPCARRRRLGAVQRRLRAPRPGAARASPSTGRPSSRPARRPGSCPSSAAPSCRIELDLGLGDGDAAYLASDLSYDYVRLNAEYTT